MSFRGEMKDFLVGFKAGNDILESRARTRLNNARAKVAEGPDDTDLAGIPDPGKGGGAVPQVSSGTGGGDAAKSGTVEGVKAPSARAEKWRQGISNIESGGPAGNYKALGKVVNRQGDRALGRYQVMASNLPNWSKQVLGKEMTVDDFLNSPAAQDQIFDSMFSSYVNKYGERGAASMWYTGSPKEPPRTDINGKLTGKTYTDKFIDFLGGEQEGPANPAAKPAAPATAAAPAADDTSDTSDTSDTDPEAVSNTGGDDGSDSSADDAGTEVSFALPEVNLPEIGVPQVAGDFSNPLANQQLYGGPESPANPNDEARPTAFAAKGGVLPEPKFQPARPEEANYTAPPVRGGALGQRLSRGATAPVQPSAAPTRSLAPERVSGATTSTSGVTAAAPAWLDPETAAKVDPRLLRVVDRARKDNPNLFALNPFTKTIRTPQEQQQMVDKGWSKTMHSKHLEGKAIDIVPINPETGEPDPNYQKGYSSIQQAIQKAAKDEGVDVPQWGGDWKTFKDRPHWQVSQAEQAQQAQPTMFAAAGGVLPEPDKYNAARAYTQPVEQSQAPQMKARRITLQPSTSSGTAATGTPAWRSWGASGSPTQTALAAQRAAQPVAAAAAPVQDNSYATQLQDWEKKRNNWTGGQTHFSNPYSIPGLQMKAIQNAGAAPKPAAGASSGDLALYNTTLAKYNQPTNYNSYYGSGAGYGGSSRREAGGMVYHDFEEGGVIPEADYARGGSVDPNRARAQAQGDLYRASRDDAYWRSRQPTVGKSGRREESGIRYTSVAGDRGPPTDTRAAPARPAAPKKGGGKPAGKGGGKKAGPKTTEAGGKEELRKAAGTPFPPEPSTFPARPEVHSDNTYPVKPQQGPPAPPRVVQPGSKGHSEPPPGSAIVDINPARWADSGSGPPPAIDNGISTIPQVRNAVPGTDVPRGGTWVDPYTGQPAIPPPEPPPAPAPQGAWINGQWVPAQTSAAPGQGFARGGVIEDDQDTAPMAGSPRAESANYTTSAPAAAPAPVARPAPAPAPTPGPVAAAAPTAAAAPAEAGAERPKADVAPTPQLLSDVGAALKGGARFLTQVFGLHGGGDGAIPGPDAQAQREQGTRRFASNEGAATPDEIQQLDDKLDPHRELDEGALQMTRLAKTTQWYLQRGEKKKAEAVAASLMQYGAQRFGRLGQVAEVGYQKYLQTKDPADLNKAIGFLSKAYEMIPDGAKMNITIDPQTHMLQATRLTADGEEEHYDVKPEELSGLIQKTVDQSGYWQQIFQLGDPAGQKQKAADRRAAEKEAAGLAKEERVSGRQTKEWERRHKVVREEKVSDTQAAAAESDRKKARDEVAAAARWKAQHPGIDFSTVQKPYSDTDAARRAIEEGVAKDDNFEDTDAGKAARQTYSEQASRLYDALPMSPKDRMAWMKNNGFPEEGWDYVEPPAAPDAGAAAPDAGAAAPATSSASPPKPADAPPDAVLKKDRDTGQPRWAVKQNGIWMWVD